MTIRKVFVEVEIEEIRVITFITGVPAVEFLSPVILLYCKIT